MSNIYNILLFIFNKLRFQVKVHSEDRNTSRLPETGMRESRAMIDKLAASPEAALSHVADGATVMIGVFGNSGIPPALIDALIAQSARNLTIVNNNAGNGDTVLAALLTASPVRTIRYSC